MLPSAVLCAFDLFELDGRDCAASRSRTARHCSPSSSRANKRFYEEDGEIVFREACKLGCEGIVSKRLGSMYRRGRSPHWVKVKNPNAPAVKREAEEDWGR
jgi:ATP-dependent DNA ligase